MSKPDPKQTGQYPVSTKFRQQAKIHLGYLLLLLHKLQVLHPEPDEDGDIHWLSYLFDRKGWKEWTCKYSPNKKEG